jgi:RNA polymerase sigma factor (sigma-70 family)
MYTKPSMFPSTGFDASEILDQATQRQIGHLARKLAARRCFRGVERDEIEQELIVHLLERWPSFDPNRSSRRTFISRVLNWKVLTLRRERRRLKRSQQSDSPDLDLTCDGARRCRRRRTAAPTQEQLERAIDLRDALRSLPAELRELAETLKSTPLGSAARELKLSPGEFRARLRRLRSELAALGLDGTE